MNGGVWYHASEKIHCKRSLHITKDGETTYYHSAKQDGELVAAKRWLQRHGEEYGWLKPTLLGDDLYSPEPYCRQVVKTGYSFIFTCKDTTYPWLHETVEHSENGERSHREWNGQYHLEYRCRWVNGVPIRYTEQAEEALTVNYLEMSILNEEKGKRTYYNRWITNKATDGGNVKPLAACGRTRWKTEKEHNNVVKNHGYNLEHNGHGEDHASEHFYLLNLLAFLFHTLLFLGEKNSRKARVLVGGTISIRRRSTPFVDFSMKTGRLLSFLSGEMSLTGDTLNC
ncbi:MAG: hypothetical protein LBF87_09105 [Treponema sp.]|jgi:hypothetical protein|nr:hypothetical protein [Treponema sp.]